MPARNKRSAIGFGFDPTESAHHFAVLLAVDGEADEVIVEERFTYGEPLEPRRPERRARVDGYTWGRVAETVQADFSRRLSDTGNTAARFVPGENLLAPYLGKELTLLLWAIERIDPTDLPNALANWQGFVPEERWWLYTTVKASGAGPDDGQNRGWRKAIRIAFAEHPAPPLAEGGRGFSPESLPLSNESEESVREISAAEADAVPKSQSRRPKARSLSLFE